MKLGLAPLAIALVLSVTGNALAKGKHPHSGTHRPHRPHVHMLEWSQAYPDHANDSPVQLATYCAANASEPVCTEPKPQTCRANEHCDAQGQCTFALVWCERA